MMRASNADVNPFKLPKSTLGSTSKNHERRDRSVETYIEQDLCAIDTGLQNMENSA
jgi:hypothetical protein